MAAAEASAVIVADDATNLSDDGYAESNRTSYLTSLASDIRKGVKEFGRTYASYGKTIQGIPIDEQEQDRNDLQHAKFLLLLDGKLHLAPISDQSQRILDLGAGFGIWTFDMADKYPTATVTGVDSAATQPLWVPPNVQFEIEDIEEDWLLAKEVDFVFGRELLMAIKDWPKVIRQAYAHLKPGGHFELEMTYPNTVCGDGSLDLDNSAYKLCADYLLDAAKKMLVSIGKKQFEDAGFKEVTETISPIPIGRWPKDKNLKKVGLFELTNIGTGLEAFLTRGFITALGRSEEELTALLALSHREIFDPNYHLNVKFVIVHGKKPLATSQ